MQKVIHCPQCKHWVNTNHVYCPLCVSNSSSTIEDWEKCRLVMCKRKACPANPAYRCTDLSDAQTACCCHLSKKILGEFVLYMSPECVIAEFFRSRLVKNMYGLEEEEVILLAQDAEAYGFHHLLLSENACDVYRGIGWERAAAAVTKVLDKMVEHSNSLDVMGPGINKAIERKEELDRSGGGIYVRER